MREFIGHEVKIAVQEVGVVTGEVVNDNKAFLFVKGVDGKTTRVAKSKICAFTPVDFEPFKYVPFYVLRCFNRKTGCPGVKYIKKGNKEGMRGFTRADFELFMEDCPCRCETCSAGSKGELRTVDSETLDEMLADSIFGDYPDPKKEKKSGSARAGKKAGNSTTDSPGDEDG